MVISSGRRSPSEREEDSGLLPDTHTHLADEIFAEDRDRVMERAVRAGVGRVLIVGSDLATSKAAVECTRRYAQAYAAVGLHPHQAEHFDRDAKEIRALLNDPKVVAVGEIGIDRARSKASIEVQVRAFREQLGWALDMNVPVSVHNRDADDMVLRVLRDYEVTVVFHCFSGSIEMADIAVEAGHFISFAGNITFPKADDLRAVARSVPLEQCLIETDSPVLAPQPWRGRRNEPAYVVDVWQTLSELRGASPLDVARQLSITADSIFRWGAA